MKVHFICRGNVLRSLIAETYLRSLQIPGVEVSSSGTNVTLLDDTERGFFANTLALCKKHGIDGYAKKTSDLLTQARVDGQDLTICMNERVIDEANRLVLMPEDVVNWHIVDIGEGHRTIAKDVRKYEEDIYEEITSHVDDLVTQTLRV